MVFFLSCNNRKVIKQQALELRVELPICWGYIFYMHLYGYHVHALCLQMLEEGIISSRTVVIDEYEPCGCWELNPGPLQMQPLLVTAELSL